MKVRADILKYSAIDDRPVLLWLLDRYPLASQWRFVASCRMERFGVLSYEVNRVWSPTPEGRVLFKHSSELA